jgi:hypothetical protein
VQDNSSTQSGGLSTGAIVGIAIGAVVVVAALVVLIIFLVKRGGGSHRKDIEMGANPAFQDIPN